MGLSYAAVVKMLRMVVNTHFVSYSVVVNYGSDKDRVGLYLHMLTPR